MTPHEAIVNMVTAVNGERPDVFYKTVEQYLETLSKGGSNYYKLKRIVENRPMKMTLLDNMNDKLKGLINYSSNECGHVFISRETSAMFQEVIEEHSNKEAFLYHRIPIRNKILLHGETGNGKTTLAKEFSRQIGLPFVLVNSDKLIDSHLGKTAANIHNVFNSISEPCVLFWDEIDTIGIKRGSPDQSAAGHENDRMTNSFLINFEKLSQEVIFIGATNRMSVLDKAFVRRFDVVHEVMPPNAEEKHLFTSQLLDFHNIPDERIDTNGFVAFYEIKNAVTKAARSYLLNQIRKPNPVDSGN